MIRSRRTPLGKASMSAIEKGDVAALTNFHRTLILSDLFRERTPSKRRPPQFGNPGIMVGN